MSQVDLEYQSLSLTILERGYWYMDESRKQRCKQISSANILLDMFNRSVPVLTTKKMYLKGIVTELLWFLKGSNNIKYLVNNNVHIWDRDAYNYHIKAQGGYFNNTNWYKQLTGTHEYGRDFGFMGELGDVGRNYGVQWRGWKGSEYDSIDEKDYIFKVDQIKNLIEGLRNKPMCRRHIVTAWNPAELDQTALPPCHWSFEVIPRPSYDFEELAFPEVPYYFTLKWHQRSVDTFLGLPFNITSYGVLCKIIEELTGYKCELLIGDLSNVHFYEGHIEDVRKQLHNDPFKYDSPTFKFSNDALGYFESYRDGDISLDKVFEILHPSDFIFENYESYPPIKADMYEPIV